MTSFYLNYLFKSPISKHISKHSETLGVKASTYEFWRNTDIHFVILFNLSLNILRSKTYKFFSVCLSTGSLDSIAVGKFTYNEERGFVFTKNSQKVEI